MPFITFEGGEGAGKSTQIALLAERLNTAGQQVVVTREPGGTAGAEAVRSLLRQGIDWLPLSETLLQFAARHEHVEHVIKPALALDKYVLCDRFSDSTIAYQGYGMGVPLVTIEQIAAISLTGFAPDLTIMLDIPVQIGLERAIGRDGTAERYEKLPIDFHRQLLAGYHTMAAAEPDRWAIVDANRGKVEIAAEIAGLMHNRFGIELS